MSSLATFDFGRTLFGRIFLRFVVSKLFWFLVLFRAMRDETRPVESNVARHVAEPHIKSTLSHLASDVDVFARFLISYLV